MPRRRRHPPCQRCASMRAAHEALDLQALAIHARVVAAMKDAADKLAPREAPTPPAPHPGHW